MKELRSELAHYKQVNDEDSEDIIEGIEQDIHELGQMIERKKKRAHKQ